jgi:hypothetical protein
MARFNKLKSGASAAAVEVRIVTNITVYAPLPEVN